jgi:glycosyltransferase involved in cell wall biosynthesis
MRTYVRHLTKVFRFVAAHSDGLVILDGLQDLALPHVHHDRTVIIAIVHLLERREELSVMGKRSRAIAERYSWQRIAERYDAFFQKVLHAKSS